MEERLESRSECKWNVGGINREPVREHATYLDQDSWGTQGVTDEEVKRRRNRECTRNITGQQTEVKGCVKRNAWESE